MRQCKIGVNLEISKYKRFNEKMLRFYEELEYFRKKVNRILDIITIIKVKPSSNHIKIRNIELKNLNFNFILRLLNLFKLDRTKNHVKNLFKIFILKIYDFLVKEFERIRITYENFQLFSIVIYLKKIYT